MYMRAYPSDNRKREVVIPPTYGGTAMERRGPSEESVRESNGERSRAQTEENGERVRPHTEENGRRSATPFKVSPSAAGLLLPRYDSENGAGLERLAAEDAGYSFRTQQNAGRGSRVSLPKERADARQKEEMSLPSLKRLFGEGELSETTLVALLLLLLGMGEENGTPLLLLGLLLLLS